MIEEGGPHRSASPEPEDEGPSAEAGPETGHAAELARAMSTAMSPARPFPVMRVAIGLAGVGLAAWVWLRVSYRWELEPADLAMRPDGSEEYEWVGRYARLRGVSGLEISLGASRPGRFVVVMAPGWFRRNIVGALSGPAAPVAPGEPETSEKALVLVGDEAEVKVGRDAEFSGRVRLVRFLSEEWRPVLDARMGRWTPPGALALVLALWGAGTGSVALVMWRRSQKRHEAAPERST